MADRPDFWTPRRVGLWAGALVACWILSAAIVGWIGARVQPVDYLSFWGAGTLVLDGQPELVYDVSAHHEATERFTGARDEPVLPWLLPPHALFIATGLTALGYYPGLAVWTLGSAALFATAAADAGKSRLAVLVAFAIPPTAWNLQIGQIGFLIAGALYWAIFDRNDRPWRGAAALLALSLKPQFGLFVVGYLVLRRRWSTLALGAGFGAAAVAASVLTFGTARWWDFLDRSGDASTITDLISGTLVWKSQSVYGLLRGLSIEVGVASVVHVIVGAVIVTHGIRLVRHRPDDMATVAYVLAGSVALSPRTLPYDLQVLALCGLLVHAGARRRGIAIPTSHLAAAFVAGGLMFIDLPGGLVSTMLILHAAFRVVRATAPERPVSPILMIPQP